MYPYKSRDLVTQTDCDDRFVLNLNIFRMLLLKVQNIYHGSLHTTKLELTNIIHQAEFLDNTGNLDYS